MKNMIALLVLSSTVLFSSITVFASETHTLEYEALRPNHEYVTTTEFLGVKDSELKKLNDLLESLKNSTKPISITLDVSNAELADEDGVYFSQQVALNRALRLRALIRQFFKTNSPELQFKISFNIDKVAPSNRAQITIEEQ